ncbi:ABC transporter substrate-binding protein [Pararhodospirillum oryzae]|uniref:ABC transporter substrate-binding protein n=1 Tax=Pararhodospirillum oryzae TaxID=478448 RepID=A0A512H6D7_9PROT|nr:ABC transporter substrate-binding protein [Pararhodospirillum oryzae]GEO81026.1 hypothetical protein ROR02_11570 [Pararhodospirillum oryzae]
MIPAEDMHFYDEPEFPEEEGAPPRRLDFLGITFPPMQREMRRRLHALYTRARVTGADQGQDIAWYVPRTVQDSFYAFLLTTPDPLDLPALALDGGLGHFARADFVRRWIDTPVFERKAQTIARPCLQGAGLEDPHGLFEVTGAGSWVILADLPRLNGRPVPRTWEDLLHPRYQRDILVNGTRGMISPVLMWNFYQDFGLDGLTALGRNTADIRGGAQMARYAGRPGPLGAALSILPRFWAFTVIHPETTRVVWPAEGAYATPQLVLRQRETTPGAALTHAFLTGPDWARGLDALGCASVRDDLGVPPLPGRVRWVGWDLVQSGRMGGERATLEAAFQQGLNAS